MVDPGKSDEVYLAGLMHDVGILVFERFMPTQFEECARMAYFRRIPLVQAETAVIGITHSSAGGGLLAEKWGFSPLIASAIKVHEDPSLDTEFKLCSSLVSAANAIAYEIGRPAMKNVPCGTDEIIDLT